MKKTILGMTFLFATLGVNAQTASVEQQTILTQDVVRNLISDLGQRENTLGLQLTDYREWQSEFKENMEKGLIQFEEGLKMKVFGPLLELTNRYGSIVDSTTIEKSQKTALLRSMKAQIDSLVPFLEAEYAQLLKDAYFSHDLLPKSVRVTGQVHHNARGKVVSKPKKDGTSFDVLTPVYTSSSAVSPNTMRSQSERIVYVAGEETYDFAAFDMRSSHSDAWRFIADNGMRDRRVEFQIKMYSNGFNDAYSFGLLKLDYSFTHFNIVNGCKSKSCVMMKTSDAVFTFQAIKQTLDKDIIFSLPKFNGVGGEITIRSLKLPVNGYFAVLNRKDVSDHVKSLPFDI